MPRIGHRRNDPTDVKVFILNPEGNYLTAAPDGLRFTPDRSRALIFDFRADQVAEQLREIQTVHGLVLRAEPVPLAEIYETCDRCKELFMPFMTFFDGKRFLCADCRRLVAGSRETKTGRKISGKPC
jgi:hypothetical protein